MTGESPQSGLPRAVTAPGGEIRWQGADGRSYDTFEEADSASATCTLNPPLEWKKPLPEGHPLGGAAIYLAMGAGGVYGLYLIFAGRVEADGWHWLGVLAGSVLLTGFLFSGLALVRDFFVANPNWDETADRVWGRYIVTLLKLAGGLIALVLGYLILGKFFGEVGTGLGIVIILLAGILLMLARIADQRRG